jgi:hypothetical protein
MRDIDVEVVPSLGEEYDKVSSTYDWNVHELWMLPYAATSLTTPSSMISFIRNVG